MQYRNCSKKLFCPPLHFWLHLKIPWKNFEKIIRPKKKIFFALKNLEKIWTFFFWPILKFFWKITNQLLYAIFVFSQKFIMRYTLVNSFPHTWASCLYVCLFLFLCFEHKWICEFPFYKKYVNTTLKKKLIFFNNFHKNSHYWALLLKFFLHPFFRKNKQNLL